MKDTGTALCFLKISSASQVADLNYFRYFETWTNQPDTRPNAQVRLLVSSLAAQIPHPTPPRGSVSAKAAGDSRAPACRQAGSSARLRVSPSDRFFIGILTNLYDTWKEALLIVQPETVIRWHRQSGSIHDRRSTTGFN
jgi:hypothetical protein